MDEDKEVTVALTSTSATQQTIAAATGIGASPAGIGEEQRRINVVQKVIQSSVTIEAGASFGSGFFYHESGLIMTAAHVVTDNFTNTVIEDVIIGITNGSVIENRVSGKVIGADTRRDIAVIKVDTDVDFKVADLALDTAVQIGQSVIAIGSPFNLENTVTAGIVSQVNRTITGDTNGSVLGFNLIQTDTPINSGNSGGALVNLSGEIVGINILIQSASGSSGNVGVGFAVPIGQAKEVADDFVRGNAQSAPAYLGITGRTSVFGRSGAFVVDVVAGEAAFNSGIRAGDLIIEAGGKEVTSFVDLLSVIQLHAPGDSVSIVLIRVPSEVGGTEERLMISLVLGSIPEI